MSYVSYQLPDDMGEGGKRFSRKMAWAKCVTVVLAIAVITVHVLSGFHTIFFFTANVVCIVLGCVSLVAPMALQVNFRKADLSMHGFCVVVQMVSAILFLAEVLKFRTQYRHGFDSLPIPDGRWRVHTTQAIVAGGLGILQALFHAAIFFVVWQKH